MYSPFATSSIAMSPPRMRSLARTLLQHVYLQTSLCRQPFRHTSFLSRLLYSHDAEREVPNRHLLLQCRHSSKERKRSAAPLLYLFARGMAASAAQDPDTVELVMHLANTPSSHDRRKILPCARTPRSALEKGPHNPAMLAQWQSGLSLRTSNSPPSRRSQAHLPSAWPDAKDKMGPIKGKDEASASRLCGSIVESQVSGAYTTVTWLRDARTAETAGNVRG